METEHWIAILGIVVSAIVAYFTAKETINAEKRKGKLIILELIKKYLISFNSSWDKNTNQLKTDNITKEQYLRVIEVIESEFKDLTGNPYYLDLAFKFPNLTMLQVYISREIAELRNQPNFALNKETMRFIFQLYSLVKGNMRKKYFTKDGQYFQLDTLIEEWKKLLNI
jgi:hypothetical protein